MINEQSEYKVEVRQILRDLKNVVPNFKNLKIEEKVGIKYNNALLWEKSAPPVIDLLMYNTEVNNIQFESLIQSKVENFPVLKLLKYYNDNTGKDIKTVITKKK